MKLSVLNAKHPSYDADTWSKYDALYKGGRAFRKSVGRFLPQNPQEPATVYQQRLRESHYRSYVGPIVDYFAAQLMAAPLAIRAVSPDSREQVEPDKFYADLKEDADGTGVDLIDMARNSFRTVLTKCSGWWLATLPENGGVEPTSEADWQERRLGDARLLPLEPESILDWEFDANGKLAWAVLYQETSPRETFAASRAIRKMVWRVYDATGVETFEKLFDPAKEQLTEDSPVASKGKVAHGFSCVPLVRIEVPEGLWLMNRVAEAQTEHFRLSSGLGWAIRRTCYAMPIFKMDGEVGPQGVGYYMKIGQNDDLTWSSPPTGTFDVISNEIKAQKDEIYRVAQQMAQGVDNNAAAIGRSGDSKQADASSTEVCLKAYGAVMREAIERALDIIANGRKDNVRFNVSGLDKFSLADAKTTVANVTSAKALNIPSKTLLEELYVSTADALLPGLSQDRKDLIAKEIAEGVELQAEEAEEADIQEEAAEPVSDADETTEPGDAADEALQDGQQKPPTPKKRPAFAGPKTDKA